ncbi:unnamed protein product [Phaedon cochleariae]|uniref:Proteasome-associated protein ECM29 homolog n=1 Tax=Phaedon cochleariae TaxID=80249 RepID=A0A9N9X452_PHACE|nr:unnamed protein product [Phaedon cochleariae]
MAVAADELMLLERVFLRLGSAETDEQLQNVLCKFLPPVLLKLSSQQEGVRKKVMELLIHVNRRIKTRPLVGLPVEALLTQYQDPSATSFVTNFTIIYLKSGFPRLPIEKQAELVPTVLNALENKPQSHCDGLLLLIVPLLGKVKVPTEPEKLANLFGLKEKPKIVKNLLDIMLDMILLPYSALSPQNPENEEQSNAVSLPVPSCMSETSYKRVTTNNLLKPEDLEEIKLGIVKFLAHGVFSNEDILIHLVVAASDTRFAVANLADTELKKVVGANEDPLSKVAPVLLSGLQKLIREGEEVHHGQAYTIIGMLGQRFPKIVYHDVGLLEMFFTNMESANPDLRLQIREGLLNLILAYKYDIYPTECDQDGRLNILFVLIKCKIYSEEPMARFAAVRTLATIFPPNHVPSKFLLLTATGDNKDEVSAEAFKSLYGTTRKNDVDMSKEKMKDKIIMPSFEEITSYITSEAEINMKNTSKCFSLGNRVLPFAVNVYAEILIYLRLCLIRDLDIPLTRDILKHPCEYSPKISHLLLSKIADTTMKKDKNPLDISWIKDQLSSTKEDVREYSAILYAAILTHSVTDNEFEVAIKDLLTQANSKNLESQHGALLAVGHCLENKISVRKAAGQKVDNWSLVKVSVEVLSPFFKHQNPLLMGAACTSIGLLGRIHGLPLDDGKPQGNGSPDPKRVATDITKIDIVTQLLDVMNNVKFSAKVRERAAKSLGLLCVGERFPHTRQVLQGFLNTAKEVIKTE